MKWEIVKLGDMATFINGYPFKPSDWATSGKEIIRIQNLTKSSGESNYFRGEIPNKFKVTKGDILISWSATLDIFEWKGEDAWLNQHIFKVQFDKMEVDRKFFVFLIKYILEDLKRQVHGATMQHITKAKFDNMPVPLPPLATQRRIAEILDKADALRQKDQALLQKYDELAQAVFVDMFGDPVRNEKGWEVEPVGRNINSIRYGTGSPPKYSDFGIPFIRATNIKKGRIVKKGMVYISPVEAKTIEKCFVKEGDLIIVRSGINTGDCGYISKEYDGCLAGYDLIVEMEPSKARFYHFLINSLWGKNIIEKLSRRAAQPHLNSDQVKSIEFIAPPLDMIKKFGFMIDIINSSYNLIETNLVDNETLFQSLLQKAFTGELVE